MDLRLWGELTGGGISTGPDGQRKATRRFLVSAPYGADGTIASSVIPVHRYDPYPTDSELLCQGADAKPHENNVLGWWIVEVSYDSQLDDKKGENNPNNPADSDKTVPPDQRPWKITCSSTQITEVLGPRDRDLTIVHPDGTFGKAVTNSAGQHFTPGIEIPGQRPVITIQGYKALNAVNDVFHKQTYEGKVNKFPWAYNGNLFAARTVRVTKDDWQTESQNGVYWWNFSISFEIKWDKWDIVVPDRGTMEADEAIEYVPGVGNVPSSIMTPILIGGVPTKEPVYLKEGKRLPEGEPIQYLTFKGYYEQDFANII